MRQTQGQGRKTGWQRRESGIAANRQLREGPEEASPISGPREGEMMNDIYTGVLQQQKDKQLQSPSKETDSMDRTGDKLSFVLVQGTRSGMGLNIGSSAT